MLSRLRRKQPGTGHDMHRAIARGPSELAYLKRRYGFTPTEAVVAQLLATGMSTLDIAARLGVQPNTVRAHLKQVLAKSGTRRQTETVALLWRHRLEQCLPSPSIGCRAAGGREQAGAEDLPAPGAR